MPFPAFFFPVETFLMFTVMLQNKPQRFELKLPATPSHIDRSPGFVDRVIVSSVKNIAPTISETLLRPPAPTTDTRSHGPLTFLANQSLAHDLIQSRRRRVTSQIKILPRRLLIDIEGVAGRGIDEKSGVGNFARPRTPGPFTRCRHRSDVRHVDGMHEHPKDAPQLHLRESSWSSQTGA